MKTFCSPLVVLDADAKRHSLNVSTAIQLRIVATLLLHLATWRRYFSRPIVNTKMIPIGLDFMPSTTVYTNILQQAVGLDLKTSQIGLRTTKFTIPHQNLLVQTESV